MGYIIEVIGRKGTHDAAAAALERELRLEKNARVRKAATALLYRVEGRVSQKHLEALGEGLLADPVTQEFHIEKDRAKQSFSSRWDGAVQVDVWYKPGVTDVVAESVLKGASDLQIQGVESVSTGVRYYLQGTLQAVQAEKIARQFLMNPLIQECAARKVKG